MKQTKVMLAWVLGVMLLVGGGAVEAADGPYMAVVTKDKTPMHAGAGRVFYKVGELKKGDVVQVQEMMYGWYRISCPEGVYSYISEAFVDAKGDGSKGVLNKDADVKAGAMSGAADESYYSQKRLNKGDAVSIVAQDGSSYKIVPPKGATVFVAPGMLRKASVRKEMELKEAEKEEEPKETKKVEEAKPEVKVEEKPVEKKVDEAVKATKVEEAAVKETKIDPATGKAVISSGDAVADAKRAGEEVKTTIEAKGPGGIQASDKGLVVDEAGVSEVFRALEEQMEPLRAKPLSERPLDQMADAYKKLRDSKASTAFDKQVIEIRLGELKRDKEIVKMLADLKAAEKKEEVQVKINRPLVVEYDAMGQLLASGVYDGKHLPRMYRLLDRSTGRTLAYVKPGKVVDGHATLGRYVGIKGKIGYDPALKLKVITVEKIDVLESAKKKASSTESKK
ncbi:hypothetical protein [Poriferisphaera sp. WC338]|uniref:hypothetical protein n=1 Tax=Poriferisphaera sp. WC338 TaxID=3425129 RepID=UPI003D81BA07